MMFARRLLLTHMILLGSTFAAGCGGCGEEEEPPTKDMSSTTDSTVDLDADMFTPDMNTDASPDDSTQDIDSNQDLDMHDMGVDMMITIVPETPEQEKILEVPLNEDPWFLDGLSAPAHVVFTEMGRPHIYAENQEDMGYVLGFVVARDRFFLMDLQRRLAQGKLSELLGDAALPNDVEARNTGMDQVTQRLMDNLTPEMEAYLDAYVNGINAYIEAVRARRANPPSEYVSFKFLLGKQKEVDMMEPFTRRDVAAMVAVIMYETNFETGDVGRTARFARLQNLYQDAQIPHATERREGAINDIWTRGIEPLYPASSASGWTIDDGSLDVSGARPAPSRPTHNPQKPTALKLNADLLERTADRLQALSDRLGKRELDNFGSNTWAIAGTHTTDGSGIVAGDGHLPLDLPSLMYQIGLDTKTFGDEQQSLRQTGLLITSLPILAVGTNGDIAWSQVNPFADITDWYAEELQLDDNGAPSATMFDGQWQPVQEVQEEYVIANVPALESEGRTEVVTRYKTFDGRLILDIEGNTYAKEDLPEGAHAVLLGSTYVVPSDTNNDGVISAVSFDYTAFDTTRYIDTLHNLAQAKTVREYQEHTRGFIGNMLYSAVTDSSGDILFTSYQAVPCRSYLARDSNDASQWAVGAHPAMLLDGTTYKGFEIPSQDNGFTDESFNDSDPYKCVVPFDQTPQTISPAQGFVFNGNNQPAPITNDASLGNDPWYIGGPWRAVRGDSIQGRLAEVAEQKMGSIEAMADIQAERRSRTGEMFAEHFINAITHARALSSNPGGSPTEVRLAALYQNNAATFDEVISRLNNWKNNGYNTHSGVDTFYNTSTEATRRDAVATMIFNAWLPRVMQKTFGDEPLEYYNSSSVVRMRTLKRMLDGRDGNSTNLASYVQSLKESAYFDILNTAEVEHSDEIILLALEEALTFLSGPESSPGEGGFNTTDMSQWLWGLRHKVKFQSILASFFGDVSFGNLDVFGITTDTLPLADNLTEDDPRSALKWFPRPGDNFAVDAGNPGFSGVQFSHGSGPVMRMIISLKDGEVSGQNIIPGGQSALNDSNFFADQVQLWLGNQTIPLRYTPEEVAEGGVWRELFIPNK